jgi:hypothetical protein
VSVASCQWGKRLFGVVCEASRFERIEEGKAGRLTYCRQAVQACWWAPAAQESKAGLFAYTER